jgi:hypothetical protein
MAVFDWIRRLQGQKGTSDKKDGGSRNNLPKVLESVDSSVPGRTADSPNTELSSPPDDEKALALESVPQSYGRLATWRGSLILLATSGSQFLDNVFMTSSNMALASIQEEFDVSSTNLQWMVSAYTLSFGGFLLLAGSLSDR